MILSKERFDYLQNKRKWLFMPMAGSLLRWAGPINISIDLFYNHNEQYEITAIKQTKYRLKFNNRRHSTILHCEYGPAKKSKFFNKDGSIDLIEEWWINGIFINVAVKQWLTENNITRPLSKSDRVLFKLRFL